MKNETLPDNPFTDSSKSADERIAWLLQELTLEEKCSLIGSSMPDLPRLGIPGIGVGGEAAHGVQQRNDWFPEKVAPEPTTAFPQPIGMSASWDRDRIRKAGEITGIEARVIANRHGGQGLSRWAPTVDLERDPRWGRNEEGYGEDPCLTGEMAGSYIQGMQGTDPDHLRCAATLKHFYGNNVEEGRGYKNSSIDPRNREELYLETFRRVIRKGHPEGVMTAYNKINGVVGMLNPEVRKVLKEECGITHAVSDGAAPVLARSMQHRYGTDAEVVAAGLKAGIDGLVNERHEYQPAALEAVELGLLTEEDLDRAITNQLRTKMKLGVFDRVPVNPYADVTETDLGSEKSRDTSLDMAHASLVLLENDGILPMDPEKEKGLAVIGALAARWDQDWYCGEPFYKSTLKKGLEEILGEPVVYDDGLDLVAFYVDEKPVCLETQEDSNRTVRLCVGESGQEPEHFRLEDYNDQCVSLMSASTGRYVVPLMAGYGAEGAGMPESENGSLVLGPGVQFDWFATTGLRMHREDDGAVTLKSRFAQNVILTENGWLKAVEAGSPVKLELRVIRSGAERAKTIAHAAKTVVLTLGSHPMLPAKEELDRRSLHLPEQQQKLLAAVTEANARTVLMLLANYPYALPETHKPAAVLMSATGSQDLGRAAADALMGRYAPAGKLAQTWYRTEDDLPPMDDYDIIGGGRTYQYFEGDVQYPFGYGKTYTEFSYQDLTVEETGSGLKAVWLLENIGSLKSDEVTELYVEFPPCRVKRPVVQLVGFERVRDMMPGERRRVEVLVPYDDLRYYDVISKQKILADGIYRFSVRSSSAEADIKIRCDAALKGVQEGTRDPYTWTCADHYDQQKGVEILEGFHGLPSVAGSSGDGSIPAEARSCELIYRDYAIWDTEREPQLLRILLNASESGSIDVLVDDGLCAIWHGNTKDAMPGTAYIMNVEDRPLFQAYTASQPARFAYAELLIMKDLPKGRRFTLTLRLYGDVEVVGFGFKEK